jgi:hypothetical protein
MGGGGWVGGGGRGQRVGPDVAEDPESAAEVRLANVVEHVPQPEPARRRAAAFVPPRLDGPLGRRRLRQDVRRGRVVAGHGAGASLLACPWTLSTVILSTIQPVPGHCPAGPSKEQDGGAGGGGFHKDGGLSILHLQRNAKIS